MGITTDAITAIKSKGSDDYNKKVFRGRVIKERSRGLSRQ